MAVWIILGVILVLLCVLLFSPIEVEIDSVNSKYMAKWKGIAGMEFHQKNDLPFVLFQVLFFKKDVNLIGLALKSKSEKKKKPTKRPTRKKFQFSKIKRLIRSFEIKEFKLNLDTDDYILNAYLFPIFFFLNKGNRKLNINFQGNFELKLLVKNRLIRLLGAFLR